MPTEILALDIVCCQLEAEQHYLSLVSPELLYIQSDIYFSTSSRPNCLTFTWRDDLPTFHFDHFHPTLHK